jgi:hypothetical protein
VYHVPFTPTLKQSPVDKELNMKALYQDTPHRTFNTRFIKAKARRVLSILKEKRDVLALFSGIYKSDKFTIEAAHQAFAGVARKK